MVDDDFIWVVVVIGVKGLKGEIKFKVFMEDSVVFNVLREFVLDDGCVMVCEGIV